MCYLVGDMEVVEVLVYQEHHHLHHQSRIQEQNPWNLNIQMNMNENF